jgi:two-component system chemotaxis response regulator CheB
MNKAARKQRKTPTSRAGGSPRVLVIGTSAGGMAALRLLVAQLPEDFAAPVFVVQHMAPENSSALLAATLDQHTALECVEARHEEVFRRGRIYFAPADSHMLLKKKTILITKGARENRSRPGIDPLFRSAAVAHGTAVIGVLLTGYLDDGTAGLIAIQRSGGVCIVQEPGDAAYPDMPQNALNQIDPDHCLPLMEMGAVLAQLVQKPARKPRALPKDIEVEARIAERVLSDLPSVNALGDQVPFNCPGCGGVLWQVGAGKSLRFRCHTGHSYTASVLWAEQSEKIEETLWIALRMFEERRNLLTTMARTRSGTELRSVQERIEHSKVHIERVRAMLQSSSDGGKGQVSVGKG